MKNMTNKPQSSEIDENTYKIDELVWKIKKIDELSIFDLYKILQIRQEVFVLEQNCAFVDADGAKDLRAHHLWAEASNGQILAYTRLLAAGVAFSEASVGRVLTHASMRGSGLGVALMHRSLDTLKSMYGAQPVRIGAQLYLKKFYEKFGFVQASEPYLEDDIWHIEMLVSLKETAI